MKEQLKHVVKVTGTDKAFAAILTDGHVVTWGDPKCGGNSSSVQTELINVREKLGPKGLGSAFEKTRSIYVLMEISNLSGSKACVPNNNRLQKKSLISRLSNLIKAKDRWELYCFCCNS